MSVKHKNSQSGFSLLELMVAIAMLTIGMLAIATMLKASSEQTKRSVQNIVGNAIALQLVEAVRSKAMSYTFSQLYSGTVSLGIQKLMPGSSALYEYQDTNVLPTTGLMTYKNTNDTQFVENLGVGRGYVYKWHLENQTASSWPTNVLKLEVTVGWSNDPANTPSDPNSSPYKTKVTTFIIASSS